MSAPIETEEGRLLHARVLTALEARYVPSNRWRRYRRLLQGRRVVALNLSLRLSHIRDVFFDFFLLRVLVRSWRRIDVL